MTADGATRRVLSLSCADVPGIVHAVTGLLLDHDANIVESQQFGDPDSGRFFMRVQFARTIPGVFDDAVLRGDLEAVAERFSMSWRLVDPDLRLRVVIMASKLAHCLNDLLFRISLGELPIEVAAVVSNHPDLQPLAARHGLPFRHIPVSHETKRAAEAELLTVIEGLRVDTVILARYMQVLTDDLCKQLEGRAINIHHSMLPSFKGARPYRQAHDRGVKLIGATAHYVTADLDEGPIIEQDVARVDHSMSEGELIAIGRDLECRALARAVRWHSENRVVLNGTRTVVFQ
ncbi:MULTISPECIES: formyltetrahydrofolate deformylase [Mycobacterium]|uniref:formyltetrahydrofolate deformylase n=1 Tax=Mycobacterium TaxID=1763 RepID=UPI00200BD3B3|nr:MULTISPECIES: formyltetrahydrofolate deformylase [Mycobacterium]UQB93112.1 formyltetrahydrofolate deformylase [Mycobacterium intracellulare]WSE46171.1 formyltetrahydrofolate deformylase [Mycobacterium sp. 3-98]